MGQEVASFVEIDEDLHVSLHFTYMKSFLDNLHDSLKMASHSICQRVASVNFEE
jgi:hypothetical protein